MFFASSVLLAMCLSANVDPRRLNAAMSTRVVHRRGAMHWTDHFPRLLTRATGARVRSVRRRSRYLLLEFDRNGAFYTERGRDDCDFLFPGEVPESAQVAAVGRRMDQVLDLGVLSPLLGDRVVISPSGAFEGASAFELQLGWQRFDP
jgi:hypothetical protein